MIFMLETYATTLGWLAGILGSLMSLSYWPQIFKIYKRKSIADISILMYLIFFPGVTVWLMYGISMNNLPLIIANALGLIGVAVIIGQYIYYKK